MHQFQREKDNSERIIATSVDYEIAREVFLHNLSTSGTLNPMTVNQRKIVEAMKDVSEKLYQNKFEFLPVNKFIGTLTLSKDSVYDNLEKMVGFGALKMKKDVVGEGGKEISVYKVVERKAFSLPPYSELYLTSLTTPTTLTSLTNLTIPQENEASKASQASKARFPLREAEEVESEEVFSRELV